jgi:serine protease Do
MSSTPDNDTPPNMKKLRAGLAAVSQNVKFGISALAIVALLGLQPYRSERASATTDRNPPVQTQDVAVGLPSFSGLVERVKPAVVSISVKAEPSATASDDDDDDDDSDKKSSNGNNPFEGTPLERLFGGKAASGPKDQGKKDAKPEPVFGEGSGFFISSDGYIVTNNHVVEGALKVDVVTDGGETFPAKVIGTDPSTDVALVKVDASKPFPYVKLAHSPVKVGDWVLALGNPFGLGGTVTAGIVSARGRDIGMGSYDDFIQIDAPVNKGNSGGPTFNQTGDVIGMNTAIFSPSGGSVGIAFAIPAATIENIVAQLKQSGHVTRGWLGVQVQPVTADLADSLGLKDAKGALVSAPQGGSPADKAGIKRGDVILQVNGLDIKDGRDLARKVASLAPSATVKVAILRNSEPQTIDVTIGQLAEEQKSPFFEENPNAQKDLSALGLSIAPAPESANGGKGVAVLRIDPDGKAADLGLVQGDIIISANGADLSNPADLEHALSAAKAAGKKHALALVQRGTNQIFIALPADLG